MPESQTKFFYQGVIPGSKSLFNRILIVKSYFPELNISGESSCDDVRFMREGINQINVFSDIDCG